MYLIVKGLLVNIIVASANFYLFTVYLRETGLPGGEVGMMPFGVLIAGTIGIIGALFSSLFFKLKSVSHIVIAYHILYFTIVFLFATSFKDLLDFQFSNISLFLVLIALLIFGVTLIILRIKKIIKLK